MCIILCYSIRVGTKNELKKVTQGLVRDRGKTWFPELTDKRKSKSWMILTYTSQFIHVIRKEYQDSPLLGNEEL